MSLSDLIKVQLSQLQQSGSLPSQVQASDPAGITATIDVTAIDAMSVEFQELSLFVPTLQNSAFDVLKQWSTDLSQRITYLLENIGPLEFDPAAGQVLIRSTPPSQLTSGTQYFEIMLSSSGNGTFTLKRFRSVAGRTGRDQVEMQMTIEVLLRLIDDLVDTIP